MSQKDTAYCLTVLHRALEYIDDGDSPAIGHLRTDDPIHRAYNDLVAIVGCARAALERMQQEAK